MPLVFAMLYLMVCLIFVNFLCRSGFLAVSSLKSSFKLSSSISVSYSFSSNSSFSACSSSFSISSSATFGLIDASFCLFLSSFYDNLLVVAFISLNFFSILNNSSTSLSSVSKSTCSFWYLSFSFSYLKTASSFSA